jgi:1-aminocyclopropane-1-carboxylate deaminase/D-cysteine desulfhydrase-like pyridoxal-dependent ACC family enzyme
VDEPQRDLQIRVANLASETSGRLGPRLEFTADEVLVNANYAAPGYGVLTGAEREAIQLFAKYEGLLLDPVYTGRAAAGLIDLIRNGFFKKDETVLFWHTGGQPALFAENYQNDLA